MAGIKGKGGQPGRSGRKSNAARDDLTKLLNRAWPKAERAEMIKRLAIQANAGDVRAAALLLSYGYGKPIERVEHTGEGGGPIETVTIYIPANGRD